MTPGYYVIKALLVIALLVLARLILAPAHSAKRLAIRRLGTLLIILFACFAVLFPATLNSLAHLIGVERGINLLVYASVIAIFMQMTSSYRRDAEAERRITQLSRALALANPLMPDDTPGPTTPAAEDPAAPDEA